MKYRLLFLSIILCGLSIGEAQAQAWVKKAAKSVFTVKTFDASGTLLGSSNGVFTGEPANGLGCFAPFRGASRAAVIDVAGKEYPVEAILGANDTYDLVKLRLTDAKKAAPMTISATANAEVGTEVWLLPYREQKSAMSATVRRVETVGEGYAYYTVRLKKDPSPQQLAEMAGIPLLNADGQLLALVQQPVTDSDTLLYAVSAVFADSLKTTGLSINDQTLRSTHIKKALPTELGQAQLTLYVAGSSTDSMEYAQLLEDFVAQFPNEPDGYVARAQFAAGADRYADADKDMAQALKVGSKPDEVHYDYSRLIYQKIIYRPEPAYESWTLDRALEEAEAAYKTNQLPAYLQQKAYILYSQKKFAEASTVYESILNSTLRSPDLFVEASRCKLMQADTVACIAMLDSAVAMFSQPYLREAAPYILARAQSCLDAGRYRDAANDLNEYEKLMAAQVNDSFYYLRYQADMGGRLYQQALNDITKAIDMNPNQEFYYAEKASLEVRVGMYAEAEATARQCINLVPEYSDGHLFLGLSLCLQGKKEEGVKSLQKALELGDEQARGLIEKYGK